MKPLHNIICFEAEWRYNSNEKKDRFNLNTEPILNWLQIQHETKVIYRHILTKEDLQFYLDHFNKNKSDVKGYDIIYFACHGDNKGICLEGKNKNISLEELNDMANNFFENKIVHFSSCSTLADEEYIENFKKISGARLVSGYQKCVEASKSGIADIAYLNYLMSCTNVGVLKNKEFSTFYKTYRSLLEELEFLAM